MSTQAGVQIRLVKCPRCRKILPESPDVSMYKCGWCGIVLKAKTREPETTQAELPLQETDSAAESQQDNVLGQTEPRSSTDHLTDSPKVTFSPDTDECDNPRHENFPLQIQESSQSKSSEWTVGSGSKSSNELRSSGEISLEVETYISEASDEHVDDQEKSDGECGEVQNLPEYEEQEHVSRENGETSPTSSTNRNGECSAVGTDENGMSASAELVDDGSKGRSSVKNPNDSIGACRSASKGSLISFYLTSDDEQPEQHYPNEMAHSFQRFNSVDTNGSSNLGEFTSHLNSIPTGRNYYAYDGSESSYDGIDDQLLHPSRKDKSTELNLNRYSGRNRMRRDAREYLSRPPFPSRSHRQNLPPPHPSFKSPEKSPYSDPEKIDLLRTVYQLTDQLQRMHFPQDRRFSYNIPPSEGDIYSAPRFDPKMAFSGEARHFRHQPSCSCCSHDWHYSAQYKNGHRYASSEPSSWSCEMKTDNQRRAEIKRLQLREKHQTAKRHLRPIAGGAPIIACYHCSELLKLPVDFLLFKKRCHKLMCNACRKVLKFSLLNGIVPYIPEASAPPPSEAGDNKPHSSYRAQVLSYSNRSFCRSYSTEEGEASSVVLPPSSPSFQKPNDGKMPAKMKGILREYRRQNDGASRSRKWGNATASVSEIEELPPLANSPLHRLMGYSTPSKVFRR